jgi:hypothetical protein
MFVRTLSNDWVQYVKQIPVQNVRTSEVDHYPCSCGKKKMYTVTKHESDQLGNSSCFHDTYPSTRAYISLADTITRLVFSLIFYRASCLASRCHFIPLKMHLISYFEGNRWITVLPSRKHYFEHKDATYDVWTENNNIWVLMAMCERGVVPDTIECSHLYITWWAFRGQTINPKR